jgi:hypothetical protein
MYPNRERLESPAGTQARDLFRAPPALSERLRPPRELGGEPGGGFIGRVSARFPPVVGESPAHSSRRHRLTQRLVQLGGVGGGGPIRGEPRGPRHELAVRQPRLGLELHGLDGHAAGGGEGSRG